MIIVLNTFGSLGDLNPYLGIALGLKSMGHAPMIATAGVYREYVEEAGIGFHPVRPDVSIDGIRAWKAGRPAGGQGPFPGHPVPSPRGGSGVPLRSLFGGLSAVRNWSSNYQIHMDIAEKIR